MSYYLFFSLVIIYFIKKLYILWCLGVLFSALWRRGPMFSFCTWPCKWCSCFDYDHHEFTVPDRSWFVGMARQPGLSVSPASCLPLFTWLNTVYSSRMHAPSVSTFISANSGISYFREKETEVTPWTVFLPSLLCLLLIGQGVLLV